LDFHKDDITASHDSQLTKPSYAASSRVLAQWLGTLQPRLEKDFMNRTRPHGTHWVGRAAVGAIACACIVVLSVAHAAESVPQPRGLGHHTQTAADKSAIEDVLATYTRSVSNGDQHAFEALLLDENVTFTSTDVVEHPNVGTIAPDIRRYSDFRHAVFESGKSLQQQFFNVKIQQDGPLAQVSLDFVTVQRDSKKGGYGWKVLQMLKVQGQWKIVSEIYTAYSLGETRK
jgi:Putative lumazine-binding